MKILHVTEAMASGTLQVIAQLAHAQIADGHTVYIVHSVRPDTPSRSKLAEILPREAFRIEVPFVTEISPARDLSSIWRFRRILRTIEPDIVHAHSSKGGAIARLACSIPGSPPVCYSPHGFSFLREDVSPFKRSLFRFAEAFLSKLTGTVIACSASEGELARRVLGAPRVAVVENAIYATNVPPRTGSDTPTVVSSGRLCYQKAPWRFFELAETLADTGARFIWIGAGDVLSDDGKYQQAPPNVEVTGWLDNNDVLKRLADADIYVLLSLWEGMPLVLLEAQTVGLPAVTTDVTGSRDVVVNGETGFVCKTSQEWTERVRQLLSNKSLRETLGAQARSMALERFSLKKQHEGTLSVYTSCREGIV